MELLKYRISSVIHYFFHYTENDGTVVILLKDGGNIGTTLSIY